MKAKKTHPWITFQLRLPPSDLRLWLRLGEIASKCQHLAGVPLRPEFAQKLHQVFLAKGIMGTTAIEGNTLSEEQVLQQIRGELELPPSQEYLKQEVQNILDLCNNEVSAQLTPAAIDKPTLCVELIKSYNRGVLRNLKVDDGVVPGEYRRHSVVVGNVYRGVPAEDCEQLMDSLCDWLNGRDFNPPDEELRIPFAVIKAVIAHLYIAWIHPFGDGNGRTARLLEFHILFSSGIALPAAHLLSDHYNQTRTEYYRQLDHASKSGGDTIPFVHYALQGFLDGIRSQLAQIREQHFVVAWENYVHEIFRERRTSPTQKRQRDLVLELSKHQWVRIADVENLSIKLAKDYGNAGDRMLQRDLNSVSKLNLIERKQGRVRARTEIVQAFLPGRVPVRTKKRPTGVGEL